MNKRALYLVTLIVGLVVNAQSEQQISNLRTFSKVYGYVKYFHPSDEASEIDWKRFASYGAARVEKCKNKEELVGELQRLFTPLAPSINFSAIEGQGYDIASITPLNTSQYKLTFWQHTGVSLGMNPGYKAPYQSVRVNGRTKKERPKNHGLLVNSYDLSDYKGKKIRIRAWARCKSSMEAKAYMRMALINNDGTTTLKKEAIVSDVWKSYEIVTQIDKSNAYIEIGAALKGNGEVFMDNVELSYWDNGAWKTIPVHNPGFEDEGISKTPKENTWYHKGNGYRSDIVHADAYNGNGSGRLYSDLESKFEIYERIFDHSPKFGELIQEVIGDSLICQLPLVLYSNDKGTYPKSSREGFHKLQEELNSTQPDEYNLKATNMLSVRLGNIINTYNVFQHFYPYLDVVDIDWDRELEKALVQSYLDKSGNDHYITLEKFTSPLNDGHMYVNYRGIMNIFTPRITWEWIEDKLVITNVLDDQLALEVGDEVTHIDGKTSKQHFEETHSRISAGTKGWLDYKAKQKSLLGAFNQKMIIRVKGEDIELNRPGTAYNEPPRQAMHERINENVFYLNLSKIEMDTITQLLPDLVKAKSIICDLRGYPNRNHMFLCHLLKEDDTSSSWMQVPKIIYPNHKDIFGYEEHGWFLRSKEPYLGDKQIIFLTNGQAISYAESYMGFIEGYDLATIIGQPTAGTNGNVNKFDLEGGFSISWTGMKVLKHDGSQHHGIGIIPDIYVSKTIEGLKSDKDETLEKAIELTKGQ